MSIDGPCSTGTKTTDASESVEKEKEQEQKRGDAGVNATKQEHKTHEEEEEEGKEEGSGVAVDAAGNQSHDSLSHNSSSRNSSSLSSSSSAHGFDGLKVAIKSSLDSLINGTATTAAMRESRADYDYGDRNDRATRAQIGASAEANGGEPASRRPFIIAVLIVSTLGVAALVFGAGDAPSGPASSLAMGGGTGFIHSSIMMRTRISKAYRRRHLHSTE